MSHIPTKPYTGSDLLNFDTVTYHATCRWCEKTMPHTSKPADDADGGILLFERDDKKDTERTTIIECCEHAKQQRARLADENVGLIHTAMNKLKRSRAQRNLFPDEDMAQVAWQALKRASQIYDTRGGWAFTTYAVGAMYNRLLSALNALQEVPAGPLGEHDPVQPDAGDDEPTVVLPDVVRVALKRLDEISAMVMYLVYEKSMSCREIECKFGWPARKAVRLRSRAEERVREAVCSEGGGELLRGVG